MALLYGGELFACRPCHQLVYPSQRERAYDRAARKAERIRARLGWAPGFLNERGSKPKWMQRGTLWRLSAEHDALLKESLEGIATRFGLAI